MTISSTTRIAGPFIGNGTASAFPFTFKVFAATDLDVIKLTVSTGTESTLVLTTDYTVSLNGDQNSNPGGTVTLTAGALPAGFTLTITSDIANLQPTDLTNQGGFYPEVITDSLDRATIQIQQIADIGDRTLKIPISDGTLNMELPTKTERANSFLSFDANGLPSVVTAGSSGAPATITRQVFSGTGSQTVFTLASDPGALGNSAQVYIGGVYQQRSTYTIAGTTLTFSAAPVAGTDNIEYVNFLTSNIGSTSADLVTYTPSGVGAVARSAASKFGETVSVKDFGAVGDGIADDTAAIQLALAVLSNGGTLMFPSGNYKVTASIQLPKMDNGEALILSGVGAGISRITFSGSGYLFVIGDGNAVSPGFHTTIERLGLYGASAVPSGAILLNSVYFWRVTDCIIRGFTNGSGVGIGSVSGMPNYHGAVMDCYFRDIPSGIRFLGTGGVGANSNFIMRCWFGVHATAAIVFDGVTTNVVTQNEFNGSITTAIQLTNAADGNKILFNQFDGPTNKVQFVNNTPDKTIIIGNTGGGSIVGIGTNTSVEDQSAGTQYRASGLTIGNASASSVSTSAVPLSVICPAGLTTDSFNVRDSASNYLFKVNQSGAGEFRGNLTTHGAVFFKNDIVGNSVVADINANTTPGAILLKLTTDSAQTANAITLQNASSMALLQVSASGAIVLTEQSDPSAPSSNQATMYVRDNGSGKTQLCVRFPTGAVQVLATEP